MPYILPKGDILLHFVLKNTTLKALVKASNFYIHSCEKIEYDHKVSFFPCVIPLRVANITGFFFQTMKHVVKFSQKYVHDSMLLHGRAFNQSLVDIVSASGKILHFAA